MSSLLSSILKCYKSQLYSLEIESFDNCEFVSFSEEYNEGPQELKVCLLKWCYLVWQRSAVFRSILSSRNLSWQVVLRGGRRKMTMRIKPGKTLIRKCQNCRICQTIPSLIMATVCFRYEEDNMIRLSLKKQKVCWANYPIMSKCHILEIFWKLGNFLLFLSTRYLVYEKYGAYLLKHDEVQKSIFTLQNKV